MDSEVAMIAMAFLVKWPQSSGSTVSRQQIEAIDITYGTRGRILLWPRRPESNPKSGKHWCNLEHCCYKHHREWLFGE